MKRNEVSLRDFWAKIKCKYSHYRSPRRIGEKKDVGKHFQETIAGNFPDMGKETVIQVQEAQGIPGRINQGRIYRDT